MEVVALASMILAGATAPAHPERKRITSESPRAVNPLPKLLRNVLREIPISYLI
jgi:hypothetical protein